jgi:hypothetical protein
MACCDFSCHHILLDYGLLYEFCGSVGGAVLLSAAKVIFQHV